jgi:ubiquitin-like protein Pup
MAGQQRIQKTAPAQAEQLVEVAEPAPQHREQADTTISDELLDEIDSVLEENAEAFVKQYVQLGGE